MLRWARKLSRKPGRYQNDNSALWENLCERWVYESHTVRPTVGFHARPAMIAKRLFFCSPPLEHFLHKSADISSISLVSWTPGQVCEAMNHRPCANCLLTCKSEDGLAWSGTSLGKSWDFFIKVNLSLRWSCSCTINLDQFYTLSAGHYWDFTAAIFWLVLVVLRGRELPYLFYHGTFVIDYKSGEDKAISKRKIVKVCRGKKKQRDAHVLSK